MLLNPRVIEKEVAERYKISMNFSEGMSWNNLFSLAARVNKKRCFLFVSKVLGKHLKVRPESALKSASELLMHWKEQDGFGCQVLKSSEGLNEEFAPFLHFREPTLIMGFSETATALAASIFLRCSGKVYMVCTTRESQSQSGEFISFQEEHSHLSTHHIFSGQANIWKQKWSQVLIVDDEVSTGRSALNSILALREVGIMCKVQRWGVLSFLDWRGELEQKVFERFEEENGVKVQIHSLLKGKFSVVEKAELIAGQERSQGQCKGMSLKEEKILPFKSGCTDSRYFEMEYRSVIGGRFGCDREEMLFLLDAARKWSRVLRGYIPKGKCVLVVGDREFMFFPLMVSYFLGDFFSCHFKTTTMSPIIPSDQEGYPISSVDCWPLVARREKREKGKEGDPTPEFCFFYNGEELSDMFWVLMPDPISSNQWDRNWCANLLEERQGGLLLDVEQAQIIFDGNSQV